MLVRYIKYLVENGHTRKTIEGYMGSLRNGDMFRYGDQEKWDTIFKDRLVGDAKDVAKKLAPEPIKKKPLTMEMLEGIMGKAEKENQFKATRNAFLVMLMMYAFLRQSEAVALTVDDVKIEEVKEEGRTQEVLCIRVKKAKNDQLGKGHVRLLQGASGQGEAGGLGVCPLRWYRKYMADKAVTEGQGDKAGAHLFEKLGKEKGPLGTRTPCHIVQQLLINEGMDKEEASKFGSHSSRRGGVTEAHLEGVPYLAIRRHGNWASDAVSEYIQTGIKEQLSVTAFVAEHGKKRKELPDTHA
jgi:integrase